jgi:splicing factor 3B subunit 3
LIHKTPVEDITLSFAEYQGKLFAGIGKTLRVYELGKKKLLRKCENRNFNSAINGIRIDEGRIFVSDIADAFHVLKYNAEESQLYIFADDVIPRWVTSFELLDYDTVVGGDKFENIFVCRLPPGCEEDAEDDPTATKFKWECGYLNGAAFKMEQVCQFYTGEVVTSIQKCTPFAGSSELILYATTMGSICALVPFETREDIDFFVHLEMYMRLEMPPLCGRDHVMFRSAYVPVKDVVDGDLCEQFCQLEYGKQKVLADELDRNTNEVLKKLEDIRNLIV